jgi:[acyl-carrier-protein] S-malonyltransferase
VTIALLCSGQGRQTRGMLALVAGLATSRAPLQAASALLGGDVGDFLNRASDDDLHADRTGQILCVTRALATAAALFPDGAPSDTLVAGYSIGEVAAWGVAGVWSPADNLALADARARAMDAASGPDDGLGYVRGLPRAAVDTLTARFGCAVAIINPDRLFVLGGPRQAIASLCEAALAEGAAHAAPMPVRVASHTPRLAAAVAPFEQALATFPARRPTLRLMTATDQRLVLDPAKASAGLAAQVANTIDWAAVLEALAERGATRVLELGPGSALADMARPVLPKAAVRAADDFHTLAGARAWLLA